MKLNGGTMSHRDIMRQLYKGLTLGAAQLSEAIQVLKISGVITQEGFKEPTYTLTGDKL